MRRTQRRLVEYWALGVTSRTQPYARGDMIPRTYNVQYPVASASGEAAALTGNQNMVAYTTESMFDGRVAVEAEAKHFIQHKGIDNWIIPTLAAGEAETSLKVVDAFLAVPAEVERLFWEKLFKDFPSLRKPFTEEKKQEFLGYFRGVIAVADDAAAVAAIGQPFFAAQWESAYINPATQWRIAEKFADAIDVYVTSLNRYEKRATREVVERVTKISLNVVSKLPWAHEQFTNPLIFEVGGFRAWHEAGGW